MPRKFQPPLCEACAAKPSVSFSHFRNGGPGRQWMFTCNCTSAKEDYYIRFSRFFENPDAILTHLNEKPWMDWAEFTDMTHRFDDEANGVITRLAVIFNTDTYR